MLGQAGFDRNGKYRLLDGIRLVSEKSTQEINNRKIYLISDRRAKRLKVLGKAKGQSFEHCVYLAWRYTKNFFNKVYGYQACEPKNPSMQIAITFFAKPRTKKRKAA